MIENEGRFEITRREVAKDKLLRGSAVALPFVGAAVPFLIFFVSFLLSATVAGKGMFLILSLISLVAGLFVGGIGSAITMFYRSRWLTGLRERIAIDGIKAEEVSWFRAEMTGEERKALKEVEAKDLLLADAYRETLASRLTATRIISSTKHELLLSRRRKNKLKYLKSERSDEFKSEIESDIEKLTRISNEAKDMESEARSRLQMIDAASRRGTELAGSDLALKKLSSRTEELPMALEAARMEEKIRQELEKETAEVMEEL